MWGLVGCSFVGGLLLSTLLGEAYLGAVTDHGGVESRGSARRLGRGLRRSGGSAGRCRGVGRLPPPPARSGVAALGKASQRGQPPRRGSSGLNRTGFSGDSIGWEIMESWED